MSGSRIAVGDRPVALVELGQHGGEDLVVGELEVVERVRLVAGELAGPHEQHLQLDEAALAIEPEDVLVAAPVRDRLLPLHRGLDRAQLVAEPRRLLEAQRLRGGRPCARSSARTSC